MSLVKFIQIPEIRDILNEYIAKLKLPKVEKYDIEVPLRDIHQASLIGTSFDYLLRYQLKSRFNIPNDGIVADSGMLAFKVLFVGSLEEEEPISIEDYKYVENLYNKSRKTYMKKNKKLTDEIVQSCINLARIDPIHRIKQFKSKWFKDKDDKNLILELRELSSVIDYSSFKGKNMTLNPIFGDASMLVGGADADIIDGNNLIEVKTTRRPKVDLGDIRQALGYYFLTKIEKPQEFFIDYLSIYHSRSGEMFTILLNIEPRVEKQLIRRFFEIADPEENDFTKTNWEELDIRYKFRKAFSRDMKYCLLCGDNTFTSIKSKVTVCLKCGEIDKI